jgi:hypothetical protein
MIGKIAYAIAVGLTYAWIAAFSSGCAGGYRACISAERTDTLVETRSTLNNTAQDFWGWMFKSKEGAK